MSANRIFRGTRLSPVRTALSPVHERLAHLKTKKRCTGQPAKEERNQSSRRSLYRENPWSFSAPLPRWRAAATTVGCGRGRVPGRSVVGALGDLKQALAVEPSAPHRRRPGRPQ